MPSIFAKSTRHVFGPAAGFAAKELQVNNGIWRVYGRNVRTTTLASNTVVLSCAVVFATAMTSAMPVCIPSERTMTLGRGDDYRFLHEGYEIKGGTGFVLKQVDLWGNVLLMHFVDGSS